MLAIADLTLRKIKEPAFLIMLIFAILVGCSSSEIESLDGQVGSGDFLSQLVNVERGHQLFTSTVFAFAITALIAIFAGATEIPRDIDSGLIMLLLSKPIKKSEYLLGKYLGVLAICGLFFVATEATIYIAHLVRSGETYGLGAFARQFYLFMGIIPIAGLTVMISTFFPDFSAMILASIYLIFSISVSMVPLLVAVLPESVSGGIEVYLYLFYYLFPNFIFYFQSFKLFGIISIALLLYSVSITVIFLSVADLRMRNRDLT